MAILAAARLWVLVLERRVFSFFVRSILTSVRVSGHGVFFPECCGDVGMGLEFDPGVGGGCRCGDHRCGDRSDDSDRGRGSVVWGVVGVVVRCWYVDSVVIAVVLRRWCVILVEIVVVFRPS